MVCDVDGTIMDHRRYISQETKDALAMLRSNGIGVTLATGRNHWEVHDIVQELNIALPVILANGAQIFDFSGDRLLYGEHLDIPAIMKFLQHFCDTYGMRVRWYDGQQWHEVSLLEFLSLGSSLVAKRLLLSVNHEWPRLIDDPSFPFWIFWDGKDHYELTPKGASKGAGLLKLCELLSLKQSQVVALGNDLNDIDLLEKAGVGLGVADGHPEIYEYADAIVAPMGDNPVADIALWMMGKLPWERIVMSR